MKVKNSVYRSRIKPVGFMRGQIPWAGIHKSTSQFDGVMDARTGGQQAAYHPTKREIGWTGIL